MGLLDDLLRGATGQQAGGAQYDREAQGQPSGGGMSRVMMALLPVVLAMLTQNRQASAPGRTQSADSGLGGLGGLGGLLGSLLGGSGGGGLGDLMGRFQRAGLGEEADSWVGRGQNRELPPGSLEKVFGRDQLSELARQLGMSEEDASRGLARLLPEVVDKVTPEGRVPDPDALVASVDALTRRYRDG